MAQEPARTHVIEKRGEQWCLLTQDKTRVLGCHASEAEAAAQETAVEASKNHAQDLFTIAGVAIFKAGTWNGDKYTDADLDSMVTASNAVGFGIPIKAGHKEEDGQPALGWVENLKRTGSTLYGDLVSLPKRVYDAIKSRAFDAVSAEIFWDLKRNGTTYPRALRGLALLGAEIPAVDLEPLRAFLHAILLPPDEAVHAYSTELKFAAMDMAPVEPDADGKCPDGYELKDGMCHMKAMADRTETKTMTAEEQAAADKAAADKAAADAAAAAAGVPVRAGEVVVNLKQLQDLQRKAARADKIDELQRNLDQETAKHAELAAQYRKDTIAAKMRAVKLPAFRVYIRALYEMASEIAEVKTYSLADDKIKLGAMAVVESLVVEMNRQADALFATYSQHKDLPKGADDEPDDIQEKIKHRVRAHCIANKLDPVKDYKVALGAVLNADPELKKQYSQS